MNIESNEVIWIGEQKIHVHVVGYGMDTKNKYIMYIKHVMAMLPVKAGIH